MFDVIIGEDNQACIAEARNNRLSDLSTNVDLKCQLLDDHVREGDFRLEYVPSKEIVAELLTKNLAFPKFKALVELAGME